MEFLRTFLIIIITIILISCREEIPPVKQVLSGSDLKLMIEDALKGDEESGSRLQGLFSYIPEDFSTYNKIEIDSIKLDSKQFFSVLIENQIPVYSLYAVLDRDLNLYLRDESLNGFLKSDWKKSGSKLYAVLTEEFRSSDSILLDRVSYYYISQHSTELVFRQFTRLQSPLRTLEQRITSFSDSAVITGISDITTRENKLGGDVFRYDVSRNRYNSEDNIFDAMISKEIKESGYDPAVPQITDFASVEKLTGTLKDTGSAREKFELSDEDFDIRLDVQWKKISRHTITNQIKKDVRGFKFINTKIGASISLFKIKSGDSASAYFTQTLSNISGKKSYRFSDEFGDNKNTCRLYEFSCPDKKIILLLEAPKSTYPNYAEVFNNIFETFKIRC